jgi:multidrug efflux system membrane fusion protein
MTRIVILVLGVLALAFVIHGLNKAGAEKGKDKKHQGAIPVTLARPIKRDLPIWVSGVGSVAPLETVDVKARVDGQLVQILFHEGDEVARGQILAQIDPRPYRALLAQAVANKARDMSQLANQKVDLARATKLAAIGAGTGQNVDTLKAQVGALAAAIDADQALIDIARLNLDFTSIRAPIAGRAGIREINTGALVRAADAAGIVTITQMAPIAVLFTVPQDDLPLLRGAGPQADVTAGARDGSGDLEHGHLLVIDNQINPSNGQVRLKAVFANGDRTLWPGELVAPRLLARTDHNVLTVPDSAISMGQNGPFLFVAHDQAASVRPIEPGVSVESVTEIRSGLSPADIVIVDGQSRLNEGSKIRAKEASREKGVQP